MILIINLGIRSECFHLYYMVPLWDLGSACTMPQQCERSSCNAYEHHGVGVMLRGLRPVLVNRLPKFENCELYVISIDLN
jgi:hypothetical protein